MADLAYLQKIMGVFFNDQTLLEQALVHSSYINENPGFALGHNERLEFLGDAVLGLVIAEKLYQDFPRIAEGEMTKLRSVLVRRDTLARAAKAIELGDYLYMGKGEEASGGRNKVTNLAGAFEAVIAAIFLDQTLAKTGDFILNSLGEELQKVGKKGTEVDYKSQLQELMQSRQQLTPIYRVVDEIGPAHDKVFTVEVITGDAVMGKGSGKSKKLAEIEAARSALEKL